MCFGRVSVSVRNIKKFYPTDAKKEVGENSELLTAWVGGLKKQVRALQPEITLQAMPRAVCGVPCRHHCW
jgi:hypothetical protein